MPRRPGVTVGHSPHRHSPTQSRDQGPVRAALEPVEAHGRWPCPRPRPQPLPPSDPPMALYGACRLTGCDATPAQATGVLRHLKTTAARILADPALENGPRNPPPKVILQPWSLACPNSFARGKSRGNVVLRFAGNNVKIGAFFWKIGSQSAPRNFRTATVFCCPPDGSIKLHLTQDLTPLFSERRIKSLVVNTGPSMDTSIPW